MGRMIYVVTYEDRCNHQSKVMLFCLALFLGMYLNNTITDYMSFISSLEVHHSVTPQGMIVHREELVNTKMVVNGYANPIDVPYDVSTLCFPPPATLARMRIDAVFWELSV